MRNLFADAGLTIHIADSGALARLSRRNSGPKFSTSQMAKPYTDVILTWMIFSVFAVVIKIVLCPWVSWTWALLPVSAPVSVALIALFLLRVMNRGGLRSIRR